MVIFHPLSKDQKKKKRRDDTGGGKGANIRSKVNTFKVLFEDEDVEALNSECTWEFSALLANCFNFTPHSSMRVCMERSWIEMLI